MPTRATPLLASERDAVTAMLAVPVAVPLLVAVQANVAEVPPAMSVAGGDPVSESCTPAAEETTGAAGCTAAALARPPLVMRSVTTKPGPMFADVGTESAPCSDAGCWTVEAGVCACAESAAPLFASEPATPITNASVPSALPVSAPDKVTVALTPPARSNAAGIAPAVHAAPPVTASDEVSVTACAVAPPALRTTTPYDSDCPREIRACSPIESMTTSPGPSTRIAPLSPSPI